jgi:hypothetical protein
MGRQEHFHNNTGNVPDSQGNAKPFSIVDWSGSHQSTIKPACSGFGALHFLTRLRRLNGLRSSTYGHSIFQLEKLLLTDSPDVHQVFDLPEWPILLAVLHNPSGDRRAYTGQRIQLLNTGRVQVDLPSFSVHRDGQAQQQSRHQTQGRKSHFSEPPSKKVST